MATNKGEDKIVAKVLMEKEEVSIEKEKRNDLGS